MKKIISFIFIIVIILIANPTVVFAATPTPTPKATTPTAAISEKLNEQINELKEKIASRVSELNLVEKRGMIGIVTEVSGSKISTTDVLGNTRFVDVDEITKFSSASNKTFGLSDLKKGTRISILGLYNKQSKRILARFINTSVDPIFLSGTVSDIDKKNFIITITTTDNKSYKLDNQTSTTISTYDLEDGLVKSGFSKLALGDRISALGFVDTKDATLVVPDRIISFIDLPINPHIKALE
ncbi:MAG TPA: hypothetical protein VLF20_02460 [Patescibacteria group bacterium]|nr:hypothetical protein [Patescibacteria group bacterium]